VAGDLPLRLIAYFRLEEPTVLNVDTYVKSYLAREYQNDAEPYGVKVEKAQGSLYRAIGVHHLKPVENNGLHNVFLMVVDDQGKAIRGIPVAWDWIGRHPDQAAVPVALDKPSPEPMGNIPMGQGQTVTVWVAGAGPSDRVSGLSTTHPDEHEGNYLYHHSFLVVWRAGGASPYTEPTELDLDGLLYELSNAEDAIGNAKAMIVAVRLSSPYNAAKVSG
jgi:hypothetical protein